MAEPASERSPLETVGLAGIGAVLQIRRNQQAASPDGRQEG